MAPRPMDPPTAADILRKLRRVVGMEKIFSRWNMLERKPGGRNQDPRAKIATFPGAITRRRQLPQRSEL